MGFNLTQAIILGAYLISSQSQSASDTTEITKSPPATFSSITCTKAGNATLATSPRDRKPIVCGRTAKSFEMTFETLAVAQEAVDEHFEMKLEDAATATAFAAR